MTTLPVQEIPPGCNCKNKNEICPMDGKCQTDKVVYKATVTEQDGTTNTYTGVTKRTF